MAGVRELSPDSLFNFMAEPTLPVVMHVGRSAARDRVRWSIPLPEEAACDPGSWVEKLNELENQGRLEGCSPLLLCVEDDALRERVVAAVSSDEVAESVLCLTLVYVLRPGGLGELSPLVLGDAKPAPLPARVQAASPGPCGPDGPPGLFIGDSDAASALEVLRALGIRAVVNATDDFPNKFEGELTYLNVPVDDLPDQDLLPHVDAVFEFIRARLEAGEGVLVHCLVGVSRSSSLVISYLMRAHGWTYDEALERLRASRWSARPNSGFVQQLRQLEGRLHPEGRAPQLLNLGQDKST